MPILRVFKNSNQGGWKNPNIKFEQHSPEVIKSAVTCVNNNQRVGFSGGWRHTSPVEVTSEQSYQEEIPNITALDIEKLKYSDLFNAAKNRMTEIEMKNLLSPALMDFQNEGDFIDLMDIESHEDLLAEVTRIRNFLSDPTSQLEGAENFTKETEALRKYGEAFNVDNRVYRADGYNPETEASFTPIDINREKAAWATFRELERKDSALIMEHYGYGQHVTQTLVAQIYDELGDVSPDTYVGWYDSGEGPQSVGKVSDVVLERLSARLNAWKKLDRNEQHLSNTFYEQGNDSVNFSSTVGLGDDYFDKRRL